MGMLEYICSVDDSLHYSFCSGVMTLVFLLVGFGSIFFLLTVVGRRYGERAMKLKYKSKIDAFKRDREECRSNWKKIIECVTTGKWNGQRVSNQLKQTYFNATLKRMDVLLNDNDNDNDDNDDKKKNNNGFVTNK